MPFLNLVESIFDPNMKTMELTLQQKRIASDLAAKEYTQEAADAVQRGLTKNAKWCSGLIQHQEPTVQEFNGVLESQDVAHDAKNYASTQTTNFEYPNDDPVNIGELIDGATYNGMVNGISLLMSILLTHLKPGLKCWQVAFAIGWPTTCTQGEIAKKFGVSKQDMQQGIDKTVKELSLRKARTMRCEEGKQRMKQSNFRRGK